MDRVDLIGRCHNLPLFPLPGAVLMPGATMPLHVFEPRYRQLVKDCLAADGVLAIPQIRAGEEPNQADAPGLYPYACVGHIVAHHELPDGRYNIVVEPIGRVRLVSERPMEHPYRVADAELLDDEPADVASVQGIGTRIRGLFLPLLGRGGTKGQAVARMLSQLPGDRVPEAIAPWVVQEGEERQAYLADANPLRRARVVESAVLTIVAEHAMGGVTAEA